MIYSSDNEIYEDETAHALGVKHPDTVNYADHLAMNEDKQLPFIPDYSGNLTLAPRPEAAGDAAKAWWNTQGLGKRLGGGKQSANPVTSGDSEQDTYAAMEKNMETNPQMSPDIDFLRKGVRVPIGELNNEPSKNISHREDKSTLGKMLSKVIESQPIENVYASNIGDNPLSKELGIEDAQTQVDKAKLRTYGRNLIQEHKEALKKIEIGLK